MARVTFYFDFSSPYGYLAAHQVESMFAPLGVTPDWRPFLLGAVFKETGQGPLLDVPLKGDYAQRDLARRARRLGLPFRLPSPFPFRAQAPARAYYVVADSDPAAARDLARRLYAAAFGEGRDISWPAAVAQVAAEAGHDGAALADAIARPPAKQRLRAETDAAIAAGVFGSPFLRVDGEPFWGADRLREAADWLAEGGW